MIELEHKFNIESLANEEKFSLLGEPTKFYKG